MFVLFQQTSYPVSTGKLGAIAVGCVGIILVSASGIGLAAESKGHCSHKEVTPMRNNSLVRNSSVNSTNIAGATPREQYCTPFTAVELATSLLALIGGSLMWSISSGKLSQATVCDSLHCTFSVHVLSSHIFESLKCQADIKNCKPRVTHVCSMCIYTAYSKRLSYKSTKLHATRPKGTVVMGTSREPLHMQCTN